MSICPCDPDLPTHLTSDHHAPAQLQERRVNGVWRDSSPPAFTTATPQGSHAAWWFTLRGRDFGPYYTRDDATAAMAFLSEADPPTEGGEK